jgi:hypothetical protein
MEIDAILCKVRAKAEEKLDDLNIVIKTVLC